MKEKFKNELLEETVLMISGVKWIIYSVLVGAIVGAVTFTFTKLVELGVLYTSEWNYYYFLLPLALFFSSFIIIKMAPQAKGHGTEKAIQTVNKNGGNMDIKVVPVKLFTTFITVIFGGSVGLEGPSTQIGAAICSFFGQLFKMDEVDKKRLVVCGISSGFVSVFGAPIGAAIFAAEVLYVGRISYISLFPCLISSFVSYNVGICLGKKPLNYNVNFIPMNDIKTFISIILFGVVVGIAAIFFINLVNLIEKGFNKIRVYAPIRGMIGGCILVILILFIGNLQYIGIGEEVIDNAINGYNLSCLGFLYKMMTTSITLGSGGSGGILTPMLFIGSSIGNAWAQIIHENISFFSAIGMISFLGACANTPIAAIIMAIELFGHSIGVYGAIACGISYIVVGHRSIYPTQLIMFSKTPSIDLSTNCEVNNVNRVTLKAKNMLIKRLLSSDKEIISKH